jgi:ABC-type dipeptide/oligopeptide/nickel transport system ATPase component
MTGLNPVFTIGEQIAESVRLHKGLIEARRRMPSGCSTWSDPGGARRTGTRISCQAACASA